MLMNLRWGENILLLKLDKLTHGFLGILVLQEVPLNREMIDIRGGIVNVFNRINSLFHQPSTLLPSKSHLDKFPS